MNVPSKDIIAMLEDDGLGLTFATNLFRGNEPASPDNCVTVFDTPGRPPQQTMKQSERYSYPSIQIRVRNRDYDTAGELINSIKNALHGSSHDTVNGTVYEAIICEIEPALLDWDENNNARWVTSFELQRHE